MITRSPQSSSFVRHFVGRAARHLLPTCPRLLQVAQAASMTTSDKPTNRLVKEESPYLLQHQHNPVWRLHLI